VRCAADPGSASAAREETPWAPSRFTSRYPIASSRTWTGEYYNCTLLRVRDSGRHFAAAEEPEAIITDIRDTFRPLR